MGIEPPAVTAPGGDADVLVVGYGPVGQALSIFLARQGWRVTTVEKYRTPFGRPRAISVDRLTGRILGAAGVAGAFDTFGEPIRQYFWVNGSGRPLLDVKMGHDVRHRWPDSTAIHQPSLEAALAERGAELPTLRLLRGFEAVALAEVGDRVEVTVRDAETGEQRILRAPWVVGCDGANSFVRRHIGATLIDSGEPSDWMACDVVAEDPDGAPPTATQYADAARPRADLSAGPGHRRCEFMRLPGEPLETFDTAENAWKMLALCGLDPANATLERFATYTCQGRNADRYRSGRIFLAGDSAHNMPPFAGQGMCTGLRDAANLAWKLSLVLAGAAGPDLLDSYETERRPDVQRAVDVSVMMGGIIEMTDPDLVSKRDAVLLGMMADPHGPEPTHPDEVALPGDETLARGVFDRTGDRHRGPAWLAPQARTGRSARDVGLDHAADLCGHDWVLLSLVEPGTLVADELLPELKKIGVRMVHLLPPTAVAVEPGTVVDVDGTYASWLTETVGATAVLVRPDFLVYGAASDADEATALVRGLLDRLA
jgi:flavoprotein hydroxylase